MNVIAREFPIPANGTVDNVLTGSAFEFVKGPTIVTAGITAQATGLLVTVQSGGQSIGEESPVLVKANVYPSLEDDMYYNFGAIAGDRLVMRVRNTTGAIIVARPLVQIQAAR